MVTDPEELGAGDMEGGSVLEEYEDAGAPLAEAPADGEIEQADLLPPEPDPAVTAAAEAETRRARERLIYTRDLASAIEAALDGDQEAITRLNGDRYAKRAWERVQAERSSAAADTARQWVQAETRFQELLAKSAYERAAELEANPALGKWYFDYQGVRGQMFGDAPRQQATQQPQRTTSLDAYYDRLMARPGAQHLTAEDREALHPVNFEDEADPVAAQAAMAEAFAERMSSRKAAPVAQSAATPQPRRTTAQAAQAAAAKAPPIVSGRPPANLDFESARDAYAEEPTEANKQAYLRARAARYANW